MKALFPDWRAQGVTVCLHEHQGGFAFNIDSVLGLVGKCESEGVTIYSDVEVRELEFASDDSVKTVVTSEGSIEVGEQLVIAPGPWAKQFWAMLGFAPTIDVRTPDGDVVKDRPMWTYWNLQEGEIHGRSPHVRHRRRRSAGSYSSRYRCASVHRTTASSSPTSSGASTSSAIGRASRAAPRRSWSKRTSSSTPIRRRRTSIPASRTCGVPRSRIR